MSPSTSTLNATNCTDAMDTSMTPTIVPRPNLQSLPSEIRQEIVKLAILGTQRKAPHGPHDLKVYKEPELPIEAGDVTMRPIVANNLNRFREWRSYLEGENRSLENPALPVLLTSRLLHDDAKTVLGLKSFKRFARYALDVISFDGRTFRPTWLSVPCRASRIDELYVRLRVFPRTEEERNRAPYWALRPWLAFYTLLDAIVSSGLFDDDGNGLIIDRVVIDFVSVEASDSQVSMQQEWGFDFLTPEEDFPEWWKYIVGGREDTSYLGHPLSAARMCCLFMQHLRRDGNIVTFMSLCRRIGDVSYCVDGGSRITVGLERLLGGNFWRSHPPSLMRPAFDRLVDHRRKIGLKPARMSQEDGGRDADLD
ncbi:hypothetical protein QBC34DRAFT_404682 [Podospora aff. communis PSN243]|uniref:Uncharacterized protein n=1 Tax=Podospora aff. communis PSN243 TaxID=3040156 RepID=A0AAV9GP29_9PEZI|nr:hypothetical protein QBC34DRAFT_404682 [Podospora aff. communis PSN243]